MKELESVFRGDEKWDGVFQWVDGWETIEDFFGELTNELP